MEPEGIPNSNIFTIVLHLLCGRSYVPKEGKNQREYSLRTIDFRTKRDNLCVVYVRKVLLTTV